MPPRKLLCFVALVVLAAACVPDPVDDDSIPNFDPEQNLMGGIQQEGMLVVAVEEDFSPWSLLDGAEATGFLPDLARLVAESLGVDIQFVGAPSSDMGGLVTDGEVHLAFPMEPVTENSLGDYAWSDPYWVAHARLLVAQDSAIEGAGDLDERAVCEDINETTEPEVTELNEAAQATRGDCGEMLTSGEVDAVLGPDVRLIHHMDGADGLQIVGEQHSTEGYSAMMLQGTGGFASFVDSVFAEADSEGDWADLYERWITPVTATAPPPHPNMTLEEAAAIFPSAR